MWIRIVKVLAFALIAGISTDAQAVTLPHGRKITGTVNAVDSTTHMVTIAVDGDEAEKRPLEVNWSDRTVAQLNGERVTFEHLRVGTKVSARYVRPLFGPAVLRTINWCETAGESR